MVYEVEVGLTQGGHDIRPRCAVPDHCSRDRYRQRQLAAFLNDAAGGRRQIGFRAAGPISQEKARLRVGQKLHLVIDAPESSYQRSVARGYQGPASGAKNLERIRLLYFSEERQSAAGHRDTVPPHIEPTRCQIPIKTLCERLVIVTRVREENTAHK